MIPKLKEAAMLPNGLLYLTFDNGEKRYLMANLTKDYLDAWSASRGKGKRIMVMVSPFLTWFGNEFDIQEDGTLILNGKGVYTPEILWEHSRKHIASAEKSFSDMRKQE